MRADSTLGASMSTTPSSPALPSVLIVSPALADANNGNWHTASRWARMLRKHCRIGVAQRWDGAPCDLLIALHARRSAPSIAAWSEAHPDRPLVVVLTGTDLYRDIRSDADAQRSLQQATHLVVLQEQGRLELEPALRAKCRVIYQSAPKLAAVDPPRRVLRVVDVGHLRDEKDPETFMRAAVRLAHRRDLRFEQIGDALDPGFEAAAARTAAACPTYRWLGALPHAATRQRIRRAHLLANCSRMEGGAQVVIEAACSGTAVVASRIPGHVGLLGVGHAGWFEVGDDAGLARLVERAADAPEFLIRLRAQTVARAPLFDPAEEAARLTELVRSALTPRTP
jgi:putative glycosyltransferase (TIGR04348 family)